MQKFEDLTGKVVKVDLDGTFLEPNKTYLLDTPDLLVGTVNSIDLLKTAVVRELTLEEVSEGLLFNLIVDPKEVNHFKVQNFDSIANVEIEDGKVFVRFKNYLPYFDAFLQLPKKEFNIAGLCDNFLVLGRSKKFFWFLHFGVECSYRISRFVYEGDTSKLVELFIDYAERLQRSICEELKVVPVSPIEVPIDKIVKPITFDK